ncbi:MAG: adenylyl-sulfate kinase [Bryobacteraceae bacterium]
MVNHEVCPGLVVWCTGLSSSGKTTICTELHNRLADRGFPVVVLDGDEIRKYISKDLGFGKADRDENIRRIGFLAQLLSRSGIIALVSAISPYRAGRKEVRECVTGFVEVHVNAPLEVCEQRDRKGIYARARRGELHGVTGIDDPYEPPEHPEVECHTDLETVDESIAKVLTAIQPALDVMVPLMSRARG